MKIFLHFIIVFFLSLSCCSQNIFDLDHSEMYADHLFRTKDFREAATEYERLVQMAPDSFYYKLNLLLSYKLSKQFEKGINRTEMLFGKEYENYPSTIIENYIQLLILQNNLNSCEHLFTKKLNLSAKVRYEYQLGLYLLTKQYHKANSFIKETDSLNLNNSERLNKLLNICKEAEKIDYKKPIVASVLSFIIPGSGKAYANDFENGALVFSIIGLYTWQSYRAFSKEGIKSYYGWGFGILASGFYLGNIYGAYKSAERENKFQDKLIQKEVNKIIINND